MSDIHRIASAGLSASVKADGAELVSLCDAAGEEMLWQAGPEWPRHAPVLFPIVGRLAGDVLRHAGRQYRMTQHGFARDSRFEWLERAPDRAVLTLVDSEATRLVFPFAFRLTMTYAAIGDTLSVAARIDNPGGEVLACSIGAHPAFRWPLAPGIAQEAHEMTFDAVESGVVRSVEGGLLGAEKPLPLDGTRLGLSPALFAGDALVMPDVASRSVRFSALGRDGAEVRALTVSWHGYKDLGIWSKPTGAPFLCIEPWFGMASPIGWDGEFSQKPGQLRLEPGESREVVWSVTRAVRP